jgi:hypothetical protein
MEKQYRAEWHLSNVGGLGGHPMPAFGGAWKPTTRGDLRRNPAARSSSAFTAMNSVLNKTEQQQVIALAAGEVTAA